MNLMEKDFKSKRVRKNRKKRKVQSKNNVVTTIVKPECFDGMTNWLILQKTLESTKERVPENSLKHSKNKTLKRPFKRRRLSQTNSKMPVSKNQADKNSQYSNMDKNDSGWISGSDLSPSSTNTNSKQNSVDRKNDETSFCDENALKELTKVLAMDCEMVGTGPDGKDSVLARVSIVNAYGQCVYDEFVKPRERVTDFRTHVSGVRPSDLKNGKDLFEVQKDVSEMIDGRKVVGHDLKHDFNVLFLGHPRSLIRDTSKYKPFREISGGRTPSLKKLTSVILGCSIQSGEHSSVEDAQAAMLLYLRHKKDWERQIKNGRRKAPQ